MTSKRMLNMFIIYWLISIVLTILQVYGVPKVNSYTFLLIIIGIVSFCLGYLIIAKRRNPTYQIKKDDISNQFNKVIDNAFYKIILILASVYVYSLLVIFFAKVVYYGTLSSVRLDYYSGDLYGPVFAQVNAFILRPLYLISLPVFSFMVLYRRNWLCFVSGFYLFGYESLGGGRIGYIRIVLAVAFLSFCLLDTYKRHKTRGFFTAVLGAVIVFSLISVVSAARKGTIGGAGMGLEGSQTATQHIITYTSGPIAALDYSIEHDYRSLLGGYQYGNLTLTPAIAFINLFSSRLGLTFPMSINELLEYKQVTYVDLSDDLSWNALYTANLYFYNDFGIFGVFLFPFVFGIIISSILTKLYKYKSLPLVVVLSYCFWCMMDSVLDYAFVSAYDFMTLFILLILGTNKRYLNCNR